MAFNAKKIFPLDLPQNAQIAVGLDIPINAPAVFRSNYTSQDAIKNDLINYLSKIETLINLDYNTIYLGNTDIVKTLNNNIISVFISGLLIHIISEYLLIHNYFCKNNCI